MKSNTTILGFLLLHMSEGRQEGMRVPGGERLALSAEDTLS